MLLFMALLTEFEKTILLSLFILAKGSTRKYTTEEELLSKFPIRQRKKVKLYLTALVKKKFITKQRNSYRINRKALKSISTYLISGPRARL